MKPQVVQTVEMFNIKSNEIESFVSLDKFSFIQRQNIAWISIENVRTQKKLKVSQL